MLIFAIHAHLKPCQPKSIRLRFGWILSFLAWLAMITPLMSPIWLKNPTLGHGVCIELAPIIMASSSSQSPKMTAKHHAMHHHHTMQPPNAFNHQPFLKSKTSNAQIAHLTHLTHYHKDKKDKPSQQHDCDICLSLVMFALAASLPALVLFAVVFMERLIALLRQLRLQYLFFLRPPSRASPAVFLNHF